MNPTELLTADYEGKRADLKYLDVELKSGTLRVFYSPVMNVKQQSAIYRHINLATGEMDTGVFLTSLMVRGLNEDGTRMFKDVERSTLENKVDYKVLQHIATEMGSLRETVDPKE